MSPSSTIAPVEPAAGAVRAAAIHDDGSGHAAALLAAEAARLQAGGCRVRGLLMTRPGGGEGCATDMVMVDLSCGDTYRVSQALGPQSDSCRADPHGFARASAVLRQALADAPELVVVNRFGALEAEGGGFRAELLDLLAHGVPLLTVVAPKHADAWQAFTGGAVQLAATADAVQAWTTQVLHHGRHAAATSR